MASRDLPLVRHALTHSQTDNCKISIMIHNLAIIREICQSPRLDLSISLLCCTQKKKKGREGLVDFNDVMDFPKGY